MASRSLAALSRGVVVFGYGVHLEENPLRPTCGRGPGSAIGGASAIPRGMERHRQQRRLRYGAGDALGSRSGGGSGDTAKIAFWPLSADVGIAAEKLRCAHVVL